METAPQFELNNAIQAWRDEVASSPAVTSNDADELEMHLRDSIIVLEGKGLAAHEAFWVARNRLGTHESLKTEFGKIHVEQVWIERVLWMLTGSIVLGLVSSLSNGFITLAAAGTYTFTKQPVILGPLTLILRLAIPALLVLFFWQSGRHREGLVWRLGPWLKAAPKTTALIAFLGTFVASAIASGAQALSAKVIPLQTYSSFVLWSWPSRVVLVLAMPFILGWLLTRTKRTEVL